ncbi:MAG TPA: cell division protein FtsA [Lentisphaeria bacterium]|nr:MAG: cell division protein FtsA [Lentisphaerae bacterium GWF2_38_69]HBM16926.1 cell division protein FtsA [Lentisphaeria bacterium]
MFKGKTVLTAIDIGTSKIRVLIGETGDREETVNLLGFAEKQSEGVIKGEISDVNRVTVILNDVCKEAEDRANTPINIDTLYVGVTGSHIASRDSSGTVLVNSADKKVTYQHVEEALRNAKSLLLPPDCIMINSVDGYSYLDGTHKETQPVGHIANKLESHTHIIYGNKNKIENFQSIVREQGFENSIPVFNGLASALAVTTSDDFIHGTITLNIGAGITEYIVFNDYVVRDLGVITFGCEHIANDLYLGLDIHINKAREIIREELHLKRMSEGHDTIDIQSSHGVRKIPIASIEKIIDLRVREMFEVVNSRIKAKKLHKQLRNGVILCGGLASMNYAQVLARSIFEVPARIGAPLDFSGTDDVLKNPGNITALGLLRYAKEDVKIRQALGTANLANKLDYGLTSMIKKTFKVFKK